MDPDGSLALLPFDAEEADPYTARISETEQDESWHLILTDGTRLMKTEAGLVLLETLRPTRWLGRALRRLRLAWLVAAANWFFHVIRAPAGRFVPDVPPIKRWP